MQRPDTLPHSVYYHGHPDPYLQPGQSKYHNLGMNGHLQAGPGLQWGGSYPGKRGGMLGDYGPRQINPDQIPATYSYPLDYDLHQEYHANGVASGKTTHFVGCNQPNPRPST